MENIKQLLKNHAGLNFHEINKSNQHDILRRTLQNRGIADIKRFSRPMPKFDFEPSDPIRQPLAWRLANHLNGFFKPGQTYREPPKNIFILVDNDADGFTSAGFMYLYLKRQYNYQAHFVYTTGKNHGIKSAAVKSKIGMLKNIGLLIIPDASLGLRDIQFLEQWNIPYLIIDHHDLNHPSTDRKNRLHIFNNQWRSTHINPQFTGVGMVYQFCTLLDKINHTNYAEDYLYLLSIGQVGDVSDVADPEIRYYIITGFQQMAKNRLLKLTTDTDRMSPHQLSFSIIPKINAVCRTGSLDDKADLLKALVQAEPDDLVTITYRRKSHVDNKFHKHHKKVSHYYLEARQLDRIKSWQKRAVKKSLGMLKNIYETRSFIIALDKTGSFYQEEAGLIATQISHKYQKPAIVLRTCGRPNYYKGSARGNTRIMSNFRKFCEQTHKFVYALGHPNAFGVEIYNKDLESLLNEFKNVDLNDKNITYNVDNLYLNDVPTKKDIVDFDENRDLFGGHVKDPQLGFAGLKVLTNRIRFYGSVFTMSAHGLKFIQFNSSDKFKAKIVAKIKSHRPLYFDIVGVPDINRFMRFHYPQIIIQNLKLVKPLNFDRNDSYDNFIF